MGTIDEKKKVTLAELTPAQRKLICDHMKATYPYEDHIWHGANCPCAHCPMGMRCDGWEDWYDCTEWVLDVDDVFDYFNVVKDKDLIEALRRPSIQIYVAASFAYEDREKTDERKEQIEQVVSKVKEAMDHKAVWYSWYLPHQLQIENAWDISLEEWSQRVYDHDLKALDAADLIIFISWGKQNNAGAAWEVGYAVAKDKPVVCIKMTEEPESLMVSNSARSIIRLDEIETYDWLDLPHYQTKLDKLS